MDEMQVQIIGECLKAAAFGPFFDDWEFATIFGLERNEVAQTALAWPDVGLSDHDVNTAVHNSIGNLTGVPIGSAERRWSEYISISRAELVTFFSRWIESN